MIILATVNIVVVLKTRLKFVRNPAVKQELVVLLSEGITLALSSLIFAAFAITCSWPRITSSLIQMQSLSLQFIQLHTVRVQIFVYYI